jgi:hypothetical protein
MCRKSAPGLCQDDVAHEKHRRRHGRNVQMISATKGWMHAVAAGTEANGDPVLEQIDDGILEGAHAAISNIRRTKSTAL